VAADIWFTTTFSRLRVTSIFNTIGNNKYCVLHLPTPNVSNRLSRYVLDKKALAEELIQYLGSRMMKKEQKNMNFDEHIDRNQYPTMKWSGAFLAEHFGNEEAFPMSVADMDLKAPPSVIEKLHKRVDHGIFGYESKSESYFAAIESWYQKIGGKYQIDYDDLETKAADPNNKILILCNPHNPVSRVWTSAELEQVAAICVRHNVFVIADEIHGDIAFQPHRFIPYLTASEIAAQNGAACISPAKTFNISGMVDAITIIPNEKHRHRFHEFAHRYQINKINVFASVAIEIAYHDGADWLDALLVYLQGNVALIREFLQANANRVSMIEPEGTFLVWLDFRELGLDAKALERFLAHEAKVALSPGYWFGREGAGFARMTIGCPRATVHRALENLAAAVKGLP
jgi:bifunctional pyridoxal-dependent enzyme with beta-cystathionase and maltose regulon repressor activities